ncbi:MAG: response regulator transcription factor [Actinobacteria bacterium]|nr:response regulator transcription factor [Actinomycetota bacterium]MBU1943896.1 response regulator transcription factor [Actinomycetota bacterium]MBU2688582.1 response regulator transcription factor [Actinomycetota bacterium]
MKYALFSDNSEYSTDLSSEMRDRGDAVVAFERADELGAMLDETFDAIVVLNPGIHQLRAIKDQTDRAGGMVSRVPLVAALGHLEALEESEALQKTDILLVRPGGCLELECRVRVVGLRRGGRGNLLSHGDLIINLDSRQVLVEGRPVDLTYKEFELLKTLAATPGRVYSREDLLRGIWGFEYFGGTRTVDVHVRRVRSKIEATGRFIETVHGVGYRFISR